MPFPHHETAFIPCQSLFWPRRPVFMKIINMVVASTGVYGNSGTCDTTSAFCMSCAVQPDTLARHRHRRRFQRLPRSAACSGTWLVGGSSLFSTFPAYCCSPGARVNDLSNKMNTQPCPRYRHGGCTICNTCDVSCSGAKYYGGKACVACLSLGLFAPQSNIAQPGDHVFRSPGVHTLPSLQ